ncbi:hypothetical protein P0O24_07445 [Methanotrichaceae archaeon M04Ac]|jgi:hypothetical protein|uniref:Uncharacterized protein n=1 Tax=Candidatus Methanocrinis alkalitolerans TaxID=3033395 RepID=A0ABT5XFK9_9EURY|nr:hypothetical protein [Candidatus Methanocrinis alkalitolerans]MCR3883003.1 hypothetical protein [Methanothrix sp.]MDF0593413.1 hypothetical protein [Candidatus Methanocrinis alkalitolerans]
MEPKVTLSFTDRHLYLMEFFPADYWRPFADSYNSLPWEERSDERLAIVAENYSYLLDLLVHARLYNLSRKPYEERFR